jgi:hypothetical protein
MATKFTKNQQVKLIGTIPEGPVQKLRMTEDGEFEYLITWTDVDGNVHERWFQEAQLTSV